MFKLAFSTLACPDWTLGQVVQAAIDSSFEGVELRTFGPGSALLPSDPALTAPTKVRQLFADAGVEIAALATSCRFDEPLGPPVIGRAMGDFERQVRRAKRRLILAGELGVRSVRVFAFEPAGGEKPSKALKRIVQRLTLLCDDARNRGVMIALENGGGWPRAEQIAQIIDAVDSPILGASYNIAAGADAGDDPAGAIDTLGDRLFIARIKDSRKGAPCPLGQGDLPCEDFARRAGSLNHPGWLVFEWDKLWLPELADPETILAQADEQLVSWLYDPSRSPRPRQEEPITV